MSTTMVTTASPKRGPRPRPTLTVPMSVELPPFPTLAADTTARLRKVVEPNARLGVALHFVLSCVAAGAPNCYIEAQLGIPNGSLFRLIKGDGHIVEYADALYQAADLMSGIGRRVLASAKNLPVRSFEARRVLGISDHLLKSADARRAQASALMRKTVSSNTQDRSASAARARAERVWGVICSDPRAGWPPMARVPRVSTDEPVAAAKELLPQFQQAIDEAPEAGKKSLRRWKASIEAYIAHREGSPAPEIHDDPGPNRAFIEAADRFVQEQRKPKKAPANTTVKPSPAHAGTARRAVSQTTEPAISEADAEYVVALREEIARLEAGEPSQEVAEKISGYKAEIEMLTP